MLFRWEYYQQKNKDINMHHFNRLKNRKLNTIKRNLIF